MRRSFPLGFALLSIHMMLIVSACTERAPLPTPTPLEQIERTSCEELENELFFERQIRPLIEEGKEPSCARCHLPGVDFRPFVQEDECSTLACLEEEDLVDLELPQDSAILSWILRGHKVLNIELEADPLVHAEYNAFNAWLTYQAKCHQQLCDENPINPCGYLAPINEEDMTLIRPDQGESHSNDASVSFDMDVDIGVNTDIGVYSDMSAELDMTLPDAEPPELDMMPPPPPPEDLCSDEGVFYQFRWSVWPLHGRCYYCHADHYSERSSQEPPPAAWMSNNREELGAERTMHRVLNSEYLNLDVPSQSLILLKPLSEEAGGLPHGGGTKMRDTEDVLYVPLLAWIEHLAECQ